MIRVFISSPADVRPERLIAERVIKRLDREFASHFRVEATLWEREPLLASHHFQDLITPPHEADIVVVILWSRLGLPLPLARYAGPLSGGEVTGTEWEFEDALAGYRSKQSPELLLYCKTAPALVPLGDRDVVENGLHQAELVRQFLHRWTEDTSGKSFTAASWPFLDAAQFETLLEDHLRRLLARRLVGPAQDEPATVSWHKGSPYRGLRVFEEEHADVFFGRTHARNELRERLVRQIGRNSAFVLVVGASGSGKSSLVRAALLPDLRLSGMVGRVGLVRAAIMHPGGEAASDCDPVHALARALLTKGALPELEATPLEYTVDRLAAMLAEAPAQAAHPIRQGLSAVGRQAGLVAGAEARLVLVVDQLEELFTAPRPAQDAFAAALAALARSGLVWIVATLRSDFFGNLERTPLLAELASGDPTFLLSQVDADEIGQIVTRPAREAGCRWEVDDASGKRLDEVVRDVAARDTAALPLLEYLLDQLWERRSEAGLLRFADYWELGGFEGAIGRRADTILKEQLPEVQAALPVLLRALVTVTPGQAMATARRPLLSRLSEGSTVRRLADALLDTSARLLIVDEFEGGTRLRVAHEALLTNWALARSLIETNQADLALRARLEELASRWRAIAAEQSDSLLLQPGLPLAEAEDLVRRWNGELDADLLAYVGRSGSVARQQQQRRRRRWQAAAAVLVVLTCTSATGAWLGVTGRQRAEANLETARLATQDADRQRNEAEAQKEASRNSLREARTSVTRFLVSQGVAKKAEDPETALAIFATALPKTVDDPEQPVPARALAGMLDAARALPMLAWVPTLGDAVAFNVDGSRMAIGERDGTVTVFDPVTAIQLDQFKAGDGRIAAMEFDAAGHELLVRSKSRDVRLWRRGTMATVATEVNEAHISGDGSHVLTASADGVLIYSSDGTAERQFPPGGGAIKRAFFSADRRRVLIWMADGQLEIWNTETGEASPAPTLPAGPFTAAALSQEGAWLVAVVGDVAQVWDTSAGKQVSSFDAPNARWAGFSASGDAVLVHLQNELHIYDRKTGRLVRILETAPLSSPVLNKDAGLLADDWNGLVRLRSVMTGTTVAAVTPPWLAGRVQFTGKGQQLAITGSSGTGIMDLHPQGPVFDVEAETWLISAVAISPDGSRLLACLANGSARLWDVPSHNLVATLTAQGKLTSCIFSEDGSRALTGDDSGLLGIWDSRDGKLLHRVPKTGEKKAEVTALASKGARIAAIYNDGLVRVLDVETGEERFGAPIPGWTQLTAVTFDPSSERLAVGNYDGAIVVLEPGGTITSLYRHSGAVRTIAFSSDGKRLVTSSADRTARVWDATAQAWDGTVSTSLLELKHEGPVNSAVFNLSGDRIFTAAEDKTARVWATKSGAQLQRFEHSTRVFNAMPIQGGRRLLTTSADAVMVWDLKTGQALSSIDPGLSDNVLASSNDLGTMIAVTGGRHSISLHAMPGASLGDLRGWATAVQFHELSAYERQELFLPSRVQQPPVQASACDKAAGFVGDPRHVGPGVLYDHIDVQLAIAACRNAVQQAAGEARYHYQLGRALQRAGDPGAEAEYQVAAGQGYASAYRGLASIKEAGGDQAGADELDKAALDLGSGVAGVQLARRSLERRGPLAERTAWYERAAALGSAEAHIELAKLAELRGNGSDGLAEALVHWATAEVLQSQQLGESSDYVRSRRVTLARLLGPALTAKAWATARR